MLQSYTGTSNTARQPHVVPSCDNKYILAEIVMSLIMQQWLRLTQGHPSCRGIVIDPEGDPGEDGNQDGRHVCLQDEVTNVPLQFKAEGQAGVGT